METIFRIDPTTWRAPVPAPHRPPVGNQRYDQWEMVHLDECRRGKPYRATATGRPMHCAPKLREVHIRQILWRDGRLHLALVVGAEEDT